MSEILEKFSYRTFSTLILLKFNVALWLERLLAKHGRVCLILSCVIPKTLKMISAAFLALTLSI